MGTWATLGKEKLDWVRTFYVAFVLQEMETYLLNAMLMTPMHTYKHCYFVKP